MIRKKSALNDVFNHKRMKLNSDGDHKHKTAGVPNDANSALVYLTSIFPSEKFQRRLPPIVMKHQIYAFIKNRTEVDKQLNEMRKKGEIRIFKLGNSEDELAVVFMEDYKKYVERSCNSNTTVGTFLNSTVSKCPDVSYSKDALLKEYGFREEHISELIQNGVLTSRDIACYWLSIPQVGEFVKTFQFGRSTTLQSVRRTKYKEILQSELEQRKLPRKALLGILYHIYDIIGADLVKCIPTSTGTVLRLRT